MRSNPKATAYNLYFHSNLTQAQIAERAGVSTRTIYDWMKQGNWKTLKANSRIMPAQIVDDIYNHISHLNWRIRNRPFEERYPSKEEAETLRKLALTIPKVKLNVSKGESAQAMINFVSWLQRRNNDAAIYVSDYIDEYLHAGRERGMDPYEFEFDADQYYNAEDYPWRTQFTFEQRVNEDTAIPPLREDSLETKNVVSEQGDKSGNEPRPNQGTETAPLPSLRGTACPDDISGKQPRQNTEEAQPELQNAEPSPTSLREGPLDFSEPPKQSEARPILESRNKQPEPNQQKTGTKSEVPPISPNPTKRPGNQPPGLKKLPTPTSENKKRKSGSKDEQLDPNDPDYVQKVFDSWKKMKKKRRE